MYNWPVLLLLLLPTAQAIGISASREPIEAIAGEDISFTFMLLNSKDKQVDVVLSVMGDLQEYITLPERELKLKKGERREVTALARFPRGFTGSGTNTIFIFATEQDKEKAQIAARTHSGVMRTFVFVDKAVKKTVEQPLQVYELPPKPAALNPAIEIGDFFRTSAQVMKQSPLTLLLAGVAVLLLVLQIQLRMQRRKERKRILDEILKR